MTEAPEGIVKYSWSGTKPSNYNTGIQVGQNAYIDTSDILGKYHKTTEYIQLTDTYIETLDLISEGIIQGPLSGKWIFSGNVGQTGWSSAYFSGYNSTSNAVSSFYLDVSLPVDDSLSIYINNLTIKDDDFHLSDNPHLLHYDILSYANNSGVIINNGDTISFSTKNIETLYTQPTWTGTITYLDGTVQIQTGGSGISSTESGPFPKYHPNGFLTINMPPFDTSRRWLRSVYWNQIPVLSDLGQFNFQNIDNAYSVGTPNGDVLQELTPEETTSRSIGTRLYAGDENAQVFRILNPNCRGTVINIKTPTLSNTNSNNGNIERINIQYQISYRPLFSTIRKIADFYSPNNVFLFGKIVSAGGYINSTRIDFNLSSFSQNGNTIQDSIGFLSDQDFIGWELRIVRTTPDSTTSLLQNATYIDSITELYGSLLSYPNSAIVRSTFDAKYFSQIPSRAFECDFIKVNIPANYDPILRTYATGGYGTTNGYWNGTFASGKAWTNNPAWCFYDLIVNNRYGLGKYIDNIDVYKFDLYNIAQYCDELVADGYGGLEPRFTCNLWLAQKDDAYKVLNDMASIFRGMIYYFNGNLNAVQDSPKSPRITFTNANVENGDFNYNSTSKKTRQSVAVVRYNDPKNFYQPAIEYIENLDSIRRYGVRELPITAFGCTSRGQAIRLGRWALYSNNLETETVSFIGGLECNLLRCGDLFEVFDYNRKLKRYGGRILQLNNTGYIGIGYTGAQLLLDDKVQINSGTQYSISIATPTYYYDPSQVSGLTSNDYNSIHRSFLQTILFSGDNSYISGNNMVLNLPTGLNSIDYNISGNPVWSIELGPNSLNNTGNFYFSSNQKDYYRTVNIKELDINRYEVVGLQYWPDKYVNIDSGLVYQSNQISNLNTVPSSPHNLLLSAYKTSNSQSYVSYAFFVNDYTNISNYFVYATTGNFIGNSVPDNQYLVNILPPRIINATALVSETGRYDFRVYSYNSNDSNFSTGCASGSVLVTNSLPITDIYIGGLILYYQN